MVPIVRNHFQFICIYVCWMVVFCGNEYGLFSNRMGVQVAMQVALAVKKAKRKVVKVKNNGGV